MAWGACDQCGSAYEECTCSSCEDTDQEDTEESFEDPGDWLFDTEVFTNEKEATSSS